MFDPWTASIDEAVDAQEKWPREEPRGPVFQWQAAQNIQQEREQIEAGDGFSILAAIASCVTYGLVAPEWLARAYLRSYRKVLSCESASWDEVFGKPYPGKKLADLRRRRQLRLAVFNSVSEIRKSEGTSIDVGLFEQVAQKFNIGKTLCSELYYEAKKMMPALPPKSEK